MTDSVGQRYYCWNSNRKDGTGKLRHIAGEQVQRYGLVSAHQSAFRFWQIADSTEMTPFAPWGCASREGAPSLPCILDSTISESI